MVLRCLGPTQGTPREHEVAQSEVYFRMVSTLQATRKFPKQLETWAGDLWRLAVARHGHLHAKEGCKEGGIRISNTPSTSYTWTNRDSTVQRQILDSVIAFGCWIVVTGASQHPCLSVSLHLLVHLAANKLLQGKCVLEGVAWMRVAFTTTCIVGCSVIVRPQAMDVWGDLSRAGYGFPDVAYGIAHP